MLRFSYLIFLVHPNCLNASLKVAVHNYEMECEHAVKNKKRPRTDNVKFEHKDTVVRRKIKNSAYLSNIDDKMCALNIAPISNWSDHYIS